jgi:hypothetical protein
MVGLILPIVLATLLALALGGSLAGWAHQQVRWWPVIFVAFAIQLALFNPPLDEQPWAIVWGPWLWVATLLAIAGVLLRNSLARGAARHAWAVAALGAGLNVLVVVSNGGAMPRAAEAGAAVDRPVSSVAGRRLSNVAPLAAETRLAWFSDVIAQPAWLPMANVVSAGDLLLTGGVAWWAFHATIAVRRRPFRGVRLPASRWQRRRPG